MRPLWGFMAVAAAICAARVAHAAEWWVDQAAAAGGDGSVARPFRTINDAKAALATGDTISIKGGTYRETVDFWHVPAGAGARTTVRAAPGEQVIIDGGQTDGFVLQAGETPNMTFQDLVIRNGATGISFYQTDGGEVIGCITQGTSEAVSFYFSSHGYVMGSTLEGSVGGKASGRRGGQERRMHLPRWRARGAAGSSWFRHPRSQPPAAPAAKARTRRPQRRAGASVVAGSGRKR